MNTKRTKYLALTRDVIRDMVVQALRGRYTLPEDAYVVNMNYDALTDDHIVHIASEEFEPVPEGQAPPHVLGEDAFTPRRRYTAAFLSGDMPIPTAFSLSALLHAIGEIRYNVPLADRFHVRVHPGDYPAAKSLEREAERISHACLVSVSADPQLPMREGMACWDVAGYCDVFFEDEEYENGHDDHTPMPPTDIIKTPYAPYRRFSDGLSLFQTNAPANPDEGPTTKSLEEAIKTFLKHKDELANFPEDHQERLNQIEEGLVAGTHEIVHNPYFDNGVLIRRVETPEERYRSKQLAELSGFLKERIKELLVADVPYYDHFSRATPEMMNHRLIEPIFHPANAVYQPPDLIEPSPPIIPPPGPDRPVDLEFITRPRVEYVPQRYDLPIQIRTGDAASLPERFCPFCEEADAYDCYAEKHPELALASTYRIAESGGPCKCSCHGRSE